MEGFDQSPIAIRAHAQTLLYGVGSSGKARLALALAFEPRYPTAPERSWTKYVRTHREPQRLLTHQETEWLDGAKVLVISFLYDTEYYRSLATELIRRRFRIPRKRAEEAAEHKLAVLGYQPGHLDPETLVAQVREELHAAQLRGVPFSAVVLDGVHNLLLQFPLLEREPLLWPTLYRLFRTEGIETISTFTFFSMAQIVTIDGSTRRTPSGSPNDRGNQADSARVDVVDSTRRRLVGSEKLFFHLLVSSADYTFVVAKNLDGRDRERNLLRVAMASTIDGFGSEPSEFLWDPDEFTYS
jgi:hypothetical protein